MPQSRRLPPRLPPTVLGVLLPLFLATPMTRSQQPPVPSSLLFRHSQAMGDQVELSLRQGDATALVLRRKLRFPPTVNEQVLHPSGSQWRHFRSQLDALGVWTWPRHCPNSGKIRDGTQWVLEIEYPDRRIQASGDNGFPGEGDQPVAQPSPTRPFQQLLQAMTELTGQSLAP